jgi:hypothetical protein
MTESLQSDNHVTIRVKICYAGVDWSKIFISEMDQDGNKNKENTGGNDKAAVRCDQNIDHSMSSSHS